MLRKAGIDPRILHGEPARDQVAAEATQVD
jgi:hypothetical protein